MSSDIGFVGSRPPLEGIAPPLLTVADISVFFGPVQVLDGVNLAVWPGERVCILGSNGSGKSTTLKAIAGLVKPKSGTVSLGSERIDTLDPSQVVRRHLSLVPQGRRVFYDQTVEANLLLGAHTRKDKPSIKADIDAVCQRFPRLGERRKQIAGSLSGGEQQMLSIGRSLMARPNFMMLDEPSLGLSPVAIQDLFRGLSQLSAEGMTMLVVEQLASHALNLADRGYVLDQGRVVAMGTVEELRSSGAVMEAYLGKATG